MALESHMQSGGYCSQIVRSFNTGGLTGASIASGGYSIQTVVNIGAELVSGVDAQLNYMALLEAGADTGGYPY